MFELFFKYRPVVFQRGELALALPAWAYVGAAAALLLAVALLVRTGRTGRLRRRQRLLLGGLRAAALLLLTFALFRPSLLVSTVVPRRNYVALLVDDSRSMRVADESGPRGARVADLLGPPAGAGGDGLWAALEDRFRVRAYAFGAGSTPVDSAGSLRFADPRTDLADALARARQELDGLPLAGVVVLTDGADNGEESLADATLELRAAGVPVHAVGVGRERISPDVEVRRVSLPREALHGTTLVADVILSHAGLGGRSVRVDVEDEGRIVGTREVELGGDGETAVQLQFPAGESGPRRIAVRARPVDGEAVEENNRRELLLEVRATPRRILYFEGAPRPELTFLRRAVAADPDLELVTLVRTAEEKYLRLGVRGPEELAGGFPATREELFVYDGLVLGDVEASFFTHDQLRMMAEFVGRRGGGLLVLGGRRALSEGGYAETPLADALPVRLPSGEVEPELVALRPDLTPAGGRDPALRVAGEEVASAERWATLPPVTSVNRVEGLKPGAVALLEGAPVGDADRRPLLATQRFGRGVSLALLAQDVWLWRMHAEVPVDDRTHETFWRQILRRLVHEVPGRVEPLVAEEPVPPGEPVTVGARVSDARHLRLNGAHVTASLTGPDGVPVGLPLRWTVERDGEFEAAFVPPEAGLYRVDVEVRPDGDSTAVESGAAYFRAGTPEVEMFGAGRRTATLRRLAEETGGRYYAADDAAALPEEIRYTESGDTVTETHPLWDMPALFLLLGLLLAGEWGVRRWWGLA